MFLLLFSYAHLVLHFLLLLLLIHLLLFLLVLLLLLLFPLLVLVLLLFLHLVLLVPRPPLPPYIWTSLQTHPGSFSSSSVPFPARIV
jgi:hypothetical protein